MSDLAFGASAEIDNDLRGNEWNYYLFVEMNTWNSFVRDILILGRNILENSSTLDPLIKINSLYVTFVKYFTGKIKVVRSTLYDLS